MAAGGNRALSFTFTTDDKQAIASLKRIEKGFKGLDVQVDRARATSNRFGNVLTGLAVGAGLRYAVTEFEDSEKALRSTEAVIKSTGNAAQVSAKQQDELVTSLSRMAGVDDEVVTGGANMLRTFTSIKGAKFGEALAASLDLAAFKGQDLASTAETVGKALNDPLKGLTKLTRQGVVFSEQQKQQVRDMVAVGDTAGAQGVILAELEKEYGGQAEAMATSSGRMKVAAGEAAESVGAVLAPALEVAANAATTAATAFTGLPAPVRTAALSLGALAYLGPKVKSGLMAAAESAGGLSSAIGGAGGAAALAEVAVLPLGVAVAGFAAKAQEASSNAAALATTTDLIGAAAESTGKSIEDAFRENYLVDLATAAPQVVSDLKGAGSSLSEFADAASGSDKDFQKYLDSLDATGPKSEAFKGYLRTVHDALGEAERGARTGKAAQDELNGSTDEAAAADKNWLGVTKDQTAALWDRAEAAKEANDETQRAIDLAGDLASAELSVASAHDAVQDAQMALGQARTDGDAEAQQRAEDDLTEAMLREVDAAEALARKTAEAEHKHYDAGDAAAVQRKKLVELRDQTGFTNGTLDGLLWRLADASRERRIAIDTSEANAAAESLLRKLERISGLVGSLGAVQANGQPVRPGAINAERQAGGDRSLPRTAGGDAAVTVNVQNMTVGGTRRDLESAAARASRAAGHKVLVGG